MFYKIILLGETAVGKTTLRRSYMGENTDNSYIKTIGVDFAYKKLGDDGFQIWDIAGESTPHMLRNHLIGTEGLIFVYDVMRPETLHKLDKWVNKAVDTLGSKIDIAVVANKIDLRTDEEGLHTEDSEQFYTRICKNISGKIRRFETSALTGNGVDDVFEWLLTVLRKE